MENKSYSEKLKHPLWQKKQLEIMKRDKFKCKFCKDEETTLEVHHLKYEGNPWWDVDNSFLITVCEHCHEEIELIKDHEGEIDISKLKIYKSSGWTDGSIVLFINYCDQKFFKIFDKKHEYIEGYNLGENTCRNIAKFLR